MSDMSAVATDRPVAFFDVDETLLSLRTLESFLLFYRERVPDIVASERLGELAQQVTQLDRAEFNRIYFGLWAGQPVAAVAEAGRAWYTASVREPGFFRPNVLNRLQRHQRRGNRIVLISGSFDAPLRPLAEDLAVDALYCTQLDSVDGAYTGRITTTMIGDDKRRTVAAYLGKARPDAVTSWGYGDHPSDLPLLESVTCPVVVGSDPVMLAAAANHGWEVLPIDRPLAPRT